jgi:glyoxylase-like metal-dependent hydrolase (beta-lactamase superfamily II)
VDAHVLAIPGHTEGSIAVHLPEQGVLFTGDTIANVGYLGLGALNLDAARTVAAFRRLAALDTNVACFGPGDPLVADTASTLHKAAFTLPRRTRAHPARRNGWGGRGNGVRPAWSGRGRPHR